MVKTTSMLEKVLLVDHGLFFTTKTPRHKERRGETVASIRNSFFVSSRLCGEFSSFCFKPHLLWRFGPIEDLVGDPLDLAFAVDARQAAVASGDLHAVAEHFVFVFQFGGG